MRKQKIKKNGHRNGKQRYLCLVCGYVFENSHRLRQNQNKVLWQKYADGKQTYQQLGKQYGRNILSIQKYLDGFAVLPDFNFLQGRKLVGMDTTYFGRNFGIMLFRAWYSHQNLYWQIVDYGTIELYKNGIEFLKQKGAEIVAIVCDGKSGLFIPLLLIKQPNNVNNYFVYLFGLIDNELSLQKKQNNYVCT